MPDQQNRVIIDTNLWINFLLTKDLSKFDAIIANKKLVLIFGEELVEEF
jgi:predicted nucleic acid-binding protein